MSEVFLYDSKPFSKDNLNVWIAFPSVSNLGMSALGFLTVFEMMDKDENIRNNRIGLLTMLKSYYGLVADFSKISK